MWGAQTQAAHLFWQDSVSIAAIVVCVQAGWVVVLHVVELLGGAVVEVRRLGDVGGFSAVSTAVVTAAVATDVSTGDWSSADWSEILEKERAEEPLRKVWLFPMHFYICHSLLVRHLTFIGT